MIVKCTRCGAHQEVPYRSYRRDFMCLMCGHTFGEPEYTDAIKTVGHGGLGRAEIARYTRRIVKGRLEVVEQKPWRKKRGRWVLPKGRKSARRRSCDW